MSLTHEDVAWIANLARLAVTDEEIEAYRTQLSAVLDYAARLNELDLTDIEPSAHAVLRQNVWREDVIEPSLPLEDVLFNAAETDQDQFLIQSVLDD
ncbi:MAG: Asp-tRNA(Asn)/Glu-tRNA(Gln) amidotransferase subunit GatC [Chloroflexota bacterium]